MHQGAAYIFDGGQANGGACSLATDCASGFCTEGVCCDSACGTCRSCLATRKGTGADGTCGLVPSGGADPACSGAACTTAGSGPNTCNGAGACGFPSPTTSCGLFACNAGKTACASPCAADTDCTVTAYCAAGACIAKKAAASACARAPECASTFCVDGVCCDHPCAGQCQACGEPGSVGTCIAVKGTPRAPRTACNGTDAACAGSCDGINIAACAYPSAGQTCGAGCSGGKVAVCDATGTCLAPAPCPGNFTCDSATNKCAAACAADADCATSFICIGGKCQTKPPATCSPDGLSSIPADDAGPPQTCSPFKCGSDGKCGNSCNSSDDCAAGSECDTSKSPGGCVLAAAPANSSGGCAVGVGPGASATGIGLGLLGLIGLARRRRKAA